ncbi:putative multiple-sugar transport system permease YteP [Spirochaetia bacterium]|nr:putative multiple-sugar transport system permease YteP [Spirochaetia bacterium]
MNTAAPALTQKKYSWVLRTLKKDRWLYIMLIPGIIYYILFRFGPMFGLLAAFENYMPFLGFSGSKWVGLSHFHRLFGDFMFPTMLRNTLVLGVMNIFLFFPVPIILALMINEARRHFFRNMVQTIIYIPHLVSWVVVAGLTYTLFTTEGGIVNEVLVMAGFQKINPLLSIGAFRPMILLQLMWKESGWGTIMFLAAIAAIDPGLYEAAQIDGAGRWQQLKSITFPSIKSTVVTMLILRIGQFLDTGFEQIMLMINPINRSVGEVFDTYIYELGIKGGQFSYSTATGLFKSMIAFTLVILANNFVKKMGEEGIF